MPYRTGFTTWPDRRLAKGDQVSVLLETNGIGGYFSALGRHFYLGEPAEEEYHYWEAAIKLQDFAAERLIPGRSVKEIYEGNAAYADRMGFKTNPRNYMHSLGSVSYTHLDVYKRQVCMYIYDCLFSYNRAGYGQAVALAFMAVLVFIGTLMTNYFRKKEMEL